MGLTAQHAAEGQARLDFSCEEKCSAASGLAGSQREHRYPIATQIEAVIR